MGGVGVRGKGKGVHQNVRAHYPKSHVRTSHQKDPVSININSKNSNNNEIWDIL